MSTPMQEQYNKLKKSYPDALLLFRLGDFYEGFDEDAKTLSRVLGITLTGRGKEETRIPMAGIPYHALKQYLPKLVDAGIKVAIAEQLEEAVPGKLVERQVTKIITAGTLTDEVSLSESKNNYIAAVFKIKNLWGISIADLTTGEFFVFEISSKDKDLPRIIDTIIHKYEVKELLLPNNLKDLRNNFENIVITYFDEDYSNTKSATELLFTQFGIKTLNGFGIADHTASLICASQIIEYLKDTQKSDLRHFIKISKLDVTGRMVLDPATIRNLELVYPINNNEVNSTLFSILNRCQTPMGQRLLRSTLIAPFLDFDEIRLRHDAVELLCENNIELEKIRTFLENVHDIARIIGKIGINSANARDLKALEQSLRNIKEISKFKILEKSEFLNKIYTTIKEFEVFDGIIDLISKSILDEPSPFLNEGNIIKDGYHQELDSIRHISHGGKEEMQKMQEAEVTRTGITSLKVKYNSVFGYYIEVSKSNLSKVPDHFVRKQTLVNAERFITQELKNLEEKILGAQSKIIELEYNLFAEIRTTLQSKISDLMTLSSNIAELDMISNFAYLSLENNYSKPKLVKTREFILKDSRHPVIEILVGENFISNDLKFNDKKDFMILTGPNMSGKSTYIRQIALVTIMSQIGCFVSASEATLPIVDRVFTRVGASDNLARGESTFMVEMSETANILNNATQDSLIILDEIGRGTSTYDGIAIAWSITNYIHDKLKSFTLFATHYHELTELEKILPRVVNYNVEVKEDADKVIFMRKIIKGGTDKSYGIYVAELAGVPKEVVSRAHEILEDLEKKKKKVSLKKNEVQFAFLPEINVEKQNSKIKDSVETKLDNQVLEDIRSIDINNLTPMEALKKLQEIKENFSKNSE